MARQGLNISGAAQRRSVPQLHQGGPDHSRSQQLQSFADNVSTLTDKGIRAYQMQKAKQEKEDKLAEELEIKRADEERSRLKIEANRRLLESGGQDYKTAHGISELDSGAPPDPDLTKFNVKGNPDIMNPVYREEYEKAFTGRKVEKFQKKLDAGADKRVSEMRKVWEKGYYDEKSGWQGTPFDKWAATALTEQKNKNYADSLGHLPHIGEFADKINYNSYELAIAKETQAHRAEVKGKLLTDGVQSWYEDRKLPTTKTKSGKTISAATDLLRQVDQLRGKQLTEHGEERGIFTKKEVHGAFIKEFSDKIFLAKSSDDPIFDSIEAVFNSPDAHKILDLDPNDPNGTGKQYANLRDAANKRIIELEREEKSKSDTETQNIKDKHTETVKSMHAQAQILRTQGTLDLDDLEALKTLYKDRESWQKGDLGLIDDIGDVIIQLEGMDPTKATRQQLTEDEQNKVNVFVEEISNIDDPIELQDKKREILGMFGGMNGREFNAKIKALEGYEKTLTKKLELKKAQDVIEKNISTQETAKLQTSARVSTKEKSSTELRDGFDDYQKKILAREDLEAVDKERLLGEREALILTKEDTEEKDQQDKDNLHDSAQQDKFFEADQAFDPETGNVQNLQKIVGKIKNPSLRKELGRIVTERANGVLSAEQAREKLNKIKIDRKAANKRMSGLTKELGVIKEMDSTKGQTALLDLERKYKEDEDFQTIMGNDPANRSYLDEIAKIHNILEAKKSPEQKEAELEERTKFVEESKLEHAKLEENAIKAVRLLKTDYTPENVKAAEDAISMKYDKFQLEGADSVNTFVFDEGRRDALRGEIDDLKVKNSDKVPDSKDLDPKKYVKYETEIEKIATLDTDKKIKDEIARIKIKLREDYQAYGLPTQAYDDLTGMLKAIDPKDPTTVDPRIDGLKTISSYFKGRWGKFDDPSEFLDKGGREGNQLYDQARSTFEGWYTAETAKPEWTAKTKSQKQEAVQEYVDRIFNEEAEKRVMGPKWNSSFKTYDNNWDAFWDSKNKNTDTNLPPIATEKGKEGDTTNIVNAGPNQSYNSIYEFFGFEVAKHTKQYIPEGS